MMLQSNTVNVTLQEEKETVMASVSGNDVLRRCVVVPGRRWQSDTWSAEAGVGLPCYTLELGVRKLKQR